MFGIFAKSFMTASRIDDRDYANTRTHWAAGERLHNQRDAEIEAHFIARRRD